MKEINAINTNFYAQLGVSKPSDEKEVKSKFYKKHSRVSKEEAMDLFEHYARYQKYTNLENPLNRVVYSGWADIGPLPADYMDATFQLIELQKVQAVENAVNEVKGQINQIVTEQIQARDKAEKEALAKWTAYTDPVMKMVNENAAERKKGKFGDKKK